MFVTKKHLDRRTVLRGLGTAIALPLLDAMTPALSAAPEYPTRMGLFYVPNGIIMEYWKPGMGKPGPPSNTEAPKVFSSQPLPARLPQTLAPLEPYRASLNLLGGLDHRTAEKGNGDHARAGGTHYTGVRPKETTGVDLELGVSVDQVAAQVVGNQTRLASLELGCEATRTAGSCDAGYSCVYENSMSWRSATVPNPTEINPRLAFERIFGSLDSNLDPAQREAIRADRQSVLDLVQDRTRQLVGSVGAADKRKIDEYLTSVREIEQQIARVEDGQAVEAGFEKPSGIPEDFAEHAKLMHDLLVAAYRGDVTRVSTLMYAREGSNRVYPVGFGDGHHPITHHRYIPELMEKVSKINVYHVEQFAYFIKRLSEIEEGDGTLLDHSMIVYGSGISDGNVHNHRDLPTILLGRGDGSIKPGRFIDYGEAPMTNFYLTMLDKMGAHPESLGDSTGRVEHLSEL